METKFNLRLFIKIIVISHLFVYLSWSFIDFSLTTPIVETLKDNGSRAIYLSILFTVLLITMPYCNPNVEDENKNNDLK